MTATVHSFSAALTQREHEDRVEQAEIAAGWFFDQATKGPKAEFDAAMQVALGMHGHLWRVQRERARAKFRDDTREARRLFDETVECFLAHGEISEELDQKWTALCAPKPIFEEIEASLRVAMAAE